MADPVGRTGGFLRREWAMGAASALGLVIAATALFLAAEGPIRLGLLIYTEQFIAVMLGLSLAICFLIYPARRGAERTALPWYDALFALAGVVLAIILAVFYPPLSQDFFAHIGEATVIGFVLVPLLLEALRRTAGPGLVAVVAVFLVYALIANLVPGTLQGRASTLPDLVAFLSIDSTAIFGTPLAIVATIVVTFIFFGNLLLATGGSEWFTDLSAAAVGRSRGGAAKIAVLASALFGSISGSAVANVASTGVITIPLMKRAGFSARIAASFEAVASTGGQIMPPVMGAAAFLMAEFLQVSYSEVVIAAAVPAVLLFLAVLIQADLVAGREHIPPVPDELIKPAREVLRAGWFFPLPFVILIVALFAWNMSPAQAALWASLAVIALSALFGFRRIRISPASLLQAVTRTGTASVEIILIGAAAGIVIGVLETSGLGFGLTFLLVEFGRGSLFLLLVLTAVICILLGMGMPTTGIYLLVATLAAPPLIELGVDPMAAHLFILYFGLMSMISPPVAVAAFAAASIAGSAPMQTALQAVRIGWPAFIIPFLFVFSPSLLLRDELFYSITATATALLGVWLVSAGAIGFLRSHLCAWQRALFVLAGFCLLIPSNAFAGAVWVEAGGGVLAIGALSMQYLWTRTAKAGGVVGKP